MSALTSAVQTTALTAFDHPADFYQTRDFGQKWEATAQLLRLHGKELLSTLLRYVAPWLLASALVQAAGSANGDPTGLIQLGSLLERVADIVGMGVAYGFIKARMNGHTVPGHRFSVGEIWDYTSHTGAYFGKAILGGLLALLGVLLLVLPGIYVGVALLLLPGVVFMESGDKGVSRCFDLIKGHWWTTAALAFVAGVLMVAIVLVPSGVIGYFLGDTESSGNSTSWFMALFIHIFAAAAVFFIQPVINVLLAFNYFSIIEAKESPGLEWRAARLGEAPATPDTPVDYSATYDNQTLL